MKNPWKTLEKRAIYKNKFGYTIRNDKVINPSGKEGEYLVLENNGYAAVVALTTDNKILLVEQWRYPIEESSIEIPCGTLESGENPLEAAKRELKEETGAVATDWVELPSHWLGNGLSNMKGYIFLALNVQLLNNVSYDETEKIILKTMPFGKALNKVKNGDSQDQRTQIGILFANEYLKDLEKISVNSNF